MSQVHRPGLRRLVSVLALAFTTGVIAGCGGGGGGSDDPPATIDTQITFSANRNPVTSEITPALMESGAGFDSNEVDSPAVVVDSARVDKYLLYYEATSAGGVNTIGVVTSDEEDFAVLTTPRTQAVALGAPGSGFDVGATDPCVVVDKSVALNTPGRYHMWFEGRSGAGGMTSTIIHATSGNGVTWSNFTQCTGLTAAFASVRVADPWVILDAGLFRLWFEAVNTTVGGADGPSVIGYAESGNGTNWTVDANTVFVTGAAGRFDAYSVGSPCVTLDENVAAGSATRYRLWYEAADSPTATQSTIGLANSANGLVWSNPVLPIALPSSDAIVPLPFDSGDLEHPAASIILDSTTMQKVYLLYYTGDGENNTSPNRIGLRRGVDP
ncbi:MAG: hypothetical protein AB7O52_09740 [Planctomycetota bacterium]